MPTRTFTFDAPEHHVLVLDATKPDKVVHGGEKFTVSDQRAFEILADRSIPVEEEAEALAKLTRPKLDDLARSVGIADPENFPSREKLIEAIEQGPPDHSPSPLSED